MSLSPFAPVAAAQLANPTPDQAQVLDQLLDDPLPGLSEALSGWEHAGVPLDVAMALFAKSREAFELAHSAPASSNWSTLVEGLEEAEVARLARSLLAHRTWQVGQVLGYALSGAAQDDLAQWDASSAERESWANNLSVYLRAQARRSDGLPAFWKQVASSSAWPEDIHCFTVPPRPETDTTPARLGLVCLGVSVVQYDWAPHAHRLALVVEQANALTEEQVVNGQPNPYYGYQVTPFVCHAGVFPATGLFLVSESEFPVESSQQWARWLRETRLEGCPPPTQEELSDLARGPFWSLFSHPQTTSTTIDPLRGLNPHQLGCDTLPLYEHLVVQIASGPAPRDLPQWVLSQAVIRAKLILTQDLMVSAPEHVLDGVARLLATLARLAHHHLKAFPITRKEVLPGPEHAHFEHLGRLLLELAEKVKGGPWADQASALKQASRHIKRLIG